VKARVKDNGRAIDPTTDFHHHLTGHYYYDRWGLPLPQLTMVRFPSFKASQQTTQLILIGTVATIVSVSILLYHFSSTKQRRDITDDDQDITRSGSTSNRTNQQEVATTATTPTKKKKKKSKTNHADRNEISAKNVIHKKNMIVDGDDDDDTDPTPRRTNLGTGSSSMTTAATTVGTEEEKDDKVIHGKIEELDKIGKAHFKDKKVGWYNILLRVVTCCLLLVTCIGDIHLEEREN
jgi:hypothetical protein